MRLKSSRWWSGFYIRSLAPSSKSECQIPNSTRILDMLVVL